MSTLAAPPPWSGPIQYVTADDLAALAVDAAAATPPGVVAAGFVILAGVMYMVCTAPPTTQSCPYEAPTPIAAPAPIIGNGSGDVYKPAPGRTFGNVNLPRGGVRRPGALGHDVEDPTNPDSQPVDSQTSPGVTLDGLQLGTGDGPRGPNPKWKRCPVCSNQVPVEAPACPLCGNTQF